MPAPKYEIVVSYVGPTRPRGPATAVGTWLRTRVDGVVTVERSPGIARDVASRPEPAFAVPTRFDRAAEVAARDAAIYGLLEHAPASAVAVIIGKSRNSVLGSSMRHRVRHGLPPRMTPSSTAAEVRHAALVAALADLPPTVVAERAAVTLRTVRAAVRRVEPPKPRRVAHTTVVCAPVVHGGERLGLVDVGPGMCRDLSDDGLCCCAPTRPGTSWCPGHYALYTRGSARAA